MGRGVTSATTHAPGEAWESRAPTAGSGLGAALASSQYGGGPGLHLGLVGAGQVAATLGGGTTEGLQ